MTMSTPTQLISANDAPKPPKLDGPKGTTVSVVLCERVYRSGNGMWVVSGTYNLLNSTAPVKPGLRVTSVLVPGNSLYFRVQGEKAKQVQSLVSIRVININGANVDGAQTIAKFDAELQEANNFSFDLGFQYPEFEIETDAIEPLRIGQPNLIYFQAEVWISGKLAAYHVVRLTLTLSLNSENTTEVIAS